MKKTKMTRTELLRRTTTHTQEKGIYESATVVSFNEWKLVAGKNKRESEETKGI